MKRPMQNQYPRVSSKEGFGKRLELALVAYYRKQAEADYYYLNCRTTSDRLTDAICVC